MPASGFPTGYIAELTNEAPVGPAKLQDSQLTEYRVFGEAVGATRMHLMTPSQEMPYALIDVVTNRSVRRCAGSIAEVR